MSRPIAVTLSEAGQQPKIEIVVVDEWAHVPHYDVQVDGKEYRLWEEADRFYVRANHTGAVKCFCNLAARNAFMWRLVLHLEHDMNDPIHVARCRECQDAWSELYEEAEATRRDALAVQYPI